MRDLVAAGSGRALGALCGSALVVMVAVGCQASVAPVSLPKKAPLSSPLPVSSPLSGAAAATAPAWTPQQREVRRAYYDAQVALNAASDSQDPVTARTILAPDILPSEIPVFIQEMAAFWQKRKISGGTLAYHVENIWLNG